VLARLPEAVIPERIPHAREPRKLPVILSPDEVVQFLESMSSLKCRAALTCCYAAGLRASEVGSLMVADVDSSRGVILVRHGKGAKDRNVMLSPQLLGILRVYWRLARPRLYLFPGRDEDHPIDPTVLHLACRSAARAAGLTKRVTMHTLRHSFATHLLENGDTRIIQVLLGHNNLSSAAPYTQVATHTIRATQSPLDRLSLEVSIGFEFCPLIGVQNCTPKHTITSMARRWPAKPITPMAIRIVHLIRNSMDFALWKDRKAITAALKTVYRAKDADAAAQIRNGDASLVLR
jgi:integrase/recombinase XerD